jgi:lambda family phage portal protein
MAGPDDFIKVMRDRAGLPEAAQVRRFEAAKMGRLTGGWSTSPTHINRDLYTDLRALRSRARELSQNNDYVRRFLGLVKNNVVGAVGPGFQVQALRDDGSVDQIDSTRLERGFADWCRPGHCDVTGRYGWVDLLNLVIETVARDGEVLVRHVTGRGKYAYQLQLIDVELLDESYNETLSNGNKIRMGVEYDAFGAATAFYLTQADSADPIYYGGARGPRVRVPADECQLLFVPQQIGQLRGVTWLHTAMLRLHHLGGFEESAVVAARAGAAKMGFYTQSLEGGATGGPEGEDDGAGNTLSTFEPGTFEKLPPGWDFKGFDPQYPHAHYGDFVRSTLRGIAAGLGVSYTSLSNDLENVNYSSIRAGVLEEREQWKALQRWLIDGFCLPVYSRWLRNTLSFTGALGSMPISKITKFDAAIFQGRRWDWVDPEKDANAHLLAINNGLKSYSQVIREQGRDPDETWRELAADREAMAALGLQPVTQGPPNGNPQAGGQEPAA